MKFKLRLILGGIAILSSFSMSYGMMRRMIPQVMIAGVTAQSFATTKMSRDTYNPYKILGVRQGALPQEIKAAYYQLAMKCHPNVAGGNAQDFCELQQAYESVINQKKDESFCNRCEITYSDKLVLSNTLGKFAPFVCQNGIHKDVFFEKENIERSIPMPKNYKAPRLQVKHVSDVIGDGVFSQDFIPAKSLIKQYTGRVDVIHHSQCDHKKYVLTICGGEYQLVIDAESIGNEIGRCNHSYDPNCYMQSILDRETGCVQFWLATLRDIQPGEELVWNYGASYWRAQGIEPVEKNVKHIFQDKQATIYALKKQSNSIIVINDNSFIECNLFASGFITIDDEIFIVIVKQEQDKLLPIILRKDNESIDCVKDIEQLAEYKKNRIVQFFIKLINDTIQKK